MAKYTRLPIQVDDLGLTARELRFVGEYCTNGFDEVKAYKKHFNVKNMSSVDIRLEALGLTNERRIKLAVERFVGVTLDPYRDKLEYQLLELYRNRAFYDVKDFYNSDGSVKPLDDIDQSLRLCIDGVKEDWKGKDADRRQVTYEIANKMMAAKALRELLKEGVTQEDEAPLQAQQRQTVRDVFEGLKGMINASKGVTPEKQKNALSEPDQSLTIEIMDDRDDDEEETVKVPSVIEKKAIELANARNKGFNIDNDPMVVQARELAQRMKK